MGRSRGGLTTKIHAVTDAKGLPIRLSITPGQDHDATAAAALLIDLQDGQIILGDKAYDADWIRRQIEDQGAAPNIPDRSNRTHRHCFSKTLYKHRNLVERFFGLLTEHALKRGSHASTHALRQAIYAYVDAHNDEGKPFKWTKTADEILAKVKRFGQRTVQVHGGSRCSTTC